MKAVLIAAMLLAMAATMTQAGDAPTKAVCRACEIRGAGHGEEKVVASRTYEGKDYHFCSKKCAEAFDGFPAGYAVQPIPRPAPEVVVSTMANGDVSLGKPSGNAILVDFWATWCAPCLKAMPELEELQQDYGGKGLTVLGVSIDEKREVVEKLLKKKPLSYAVAMDSKEHPAWQAFAVAAIPAMYLIDQEGQIVGEWRGAVEMKDVRRGVEALLAGPATN